MTTWAHGTCKPFLQCSPITACPVDIPGSCVKYITSAVGFCGHAYLNLNAPIYFCLQWVPGAGLAKTLFITAHERLNYVGFDIGTPVLSVPLGVLG